MEVSKRNALFFILGSIGYGVIELMWRGHTHWSMLIAGGICFCCFSHIAERLINYPLIFKAALCSLTVTVVELVFGFVFNITFKLGVWNYSELPLNYKGQICLGFSLLWGLVGVAFIPLAELINRRIFRL